MSIYRYILYLKGYAQLYMNIALHVEIYTYIFQIYLIQDIDLCYCAFNLYAFMQLIYLIMHRIK